MQVNNAGADVAPIHYLGPIIVASRDRPVRIKFTNKLPTGAGGNLFIPVDTTYMGAGAGPTVAIIHKTEPHSTSTAVTPSGSAMELLINGQLLLAKILPILKVFS